MSLAEEGPRLPPFPDELLDPGRVEDALAFIRGLGLPELHAVSLLSRWAEVTEAPIGPREFQAVRTASRAPGGP